MLCFLDHHGIAIAQVESSGVSPLVFQQRMVGHRVRLGYLNATRGVAGPQCFGENGITSLAASGGTTIPLPTSKAHHVMQRSELIFLILKLVCREEVLVMDRLKASPRSCPRDARTTRIDPSVASLRV